MIRKVLTVSAVAATFILGGCSTNGADGGKVQPSISKPTGSLSDLNKEISGAKEKNSPLAKSIEKISNINAKKLIKDTHIDTGKGGEKSGIMLGKSLTQDPPKCIEDGIVVSDDETSAKGTFTFDHCDFDGIKINGSFTVDFTQTHTGTYETKGSSEVEYSASTAFDFEYDTVKIHVDEAVTEGNEKRAYDYESENGFSKRNAENASGISAYVSESGEKLLILDGLNSTVKYSKNSQWGDVEKDSSSYEFSISGFVGSDATGMFEVKTPKTVKGDESKDCPTEGKITVTDKDGNTLSVESDGNKITTNDGTNVDEFDCNDGGGGDSQDPEHGGQD